MYFIKNEYVKYNLMQQITDAGVKALAFSTRLLVKLNVSGCKQVLTVHVCRLIYSMYNDENTTCTVKVPMLQCYMSILFLLM